MKIGLEPSTQTVPESNATNANFTRTNSTQSLAGANRDVGQAMDFLIALFFGRKKIPMYCAQTIVFGVLLMMDCPKHSLEYYLTGLFGWTNPVLLAVLSGVVRLQVTSLHTTCICLCSPSKSCSSLRQSLNLEAVTSSTQTVAASCLIPVAICSADTRTCGADEKRP